MNINLFLVLIIIITNLLKNDQQLHEFTKNARKITIKLINER